MTEAVVRPFSPSVGGRREGRVREDLLAQVEACSDLPDVPDALGWHALFGPVAEPRSLLNLFDQASGSRGLDTVVWEADGESWFAWGVAHQIVASGDSRFSMVRQASDEVSISALSPAGKSAETCPRWFGGFSFEPGEPNEFRATGSSPWQPFGEGAFVLPRIAVLRRGREDVVWFVVLDHRDRCQPEECDTLVALSRVWDSLENSPKTGPAMPWLTGSLSTTLAQAGQALELDSEPWVEPASASLFEEKIREVVELIQSGVAQKIVAADQRVVWLDRSPDLGTVLESWAHRAPESTRFLFRRGDHAFLGATPERLVRLAGRQVRSPALAGTLPKRSSTAESASETARQAAGSSAPLSTDGLDLTGQPQELEERLLGNAKEQHEHEFVVRHIVERLDPICGWVRVAEKPEVLELHDLLHLKTLVEGELEEGYHVLDIVARLHPTPAVCGLPVEVASQWIHEREVAPRGWYSGPVGWFDASGDGDFHVALRSMLLSPDQGNGPAAKKGGTQARLFAGVGLVAGSVAAEEQRELAAKFLTAGRTLGEWINPSESTSEPDLG